MQSSLHRGICYPIIIPNQDLTLRQKIAGVHMQSPGLSVTQRMILRSFNQFQKVPAKSLGLENFNDEFSCLDPFWMIFLHQKSTESRLKTWSRNRKPMNRYNQTNIIRAFFLYLVKPFLMVKGENVYLSRISPTPGHQKTHLASLPKGVFIFH